MVCGFYRVGDVGEEIERFLIACFPPDDGLKRAISIVCEADVFQVLVVPFFWVTRLECEGEESVADLAVFGGATNIVPGVGCNTFEKVNAIELPIAQKGDGESSQMRWPVF